MTTFAIALDTSAVQHTVSVAAAFRAWLETKEGEQYREISLFQIAYRLVRREDDSPLPTAARVNSGIEYLRAVAMGGVCPVDNAITANFAHGAFAFYAADLLMTKEQKEIWGTGGQHAPLCSAEKFVAAMNAFGQTPFLLAAGVERNGGQILYDAVASGGSSQSKLLAAIGQVASTGGLTSKILKEIVEALPVDGHRFDTLAPNILAAMRQPEREVRN